MKKTIPFIFSVLAIASIASIAVLGNTQTVYAGGGCTIDPELVEVVLGPGGESQIIPKTIDCGEDVNTVNINGIDCSNSGLSIVTFNREVDVNTGIWHADERITNDENAVPGDVFCDIVFLVEEFIFGQSVLIQTIMVTTPESEPPVVGGEFLPIDSTALLLAGAQSFSWMIPVILSGIGIGLFAVSRKSE